jgi:hypothetical protein
MGLEGDKLEDVVLDTLAGVLVEVDEIVNVLVAGVVVGVW